MHNQFPHDIIIDILVKLPVRSLSRFKGVCKSWCSLIEDGQFIKLHHDTSKSDINRHKIFLACTSNDHRNYYSVDASLQHDSVVSLIKSPVPEINDLTTRVCSSSYNGILLVICSYDLIVLWNPAIRESKIIPSPILKKRERKRFPGIYAFSYVSSIDDYKIVRVGNKSYLGYHDIEIFSTKSNSWKLIDKFPPYNYYLSDGDIVVVDEIVYIMAGSRELNRIVSLCLEKEQFQEVLFPNRVQSWENPILYAVGENLCLARLLFDDSMFSYEVWCMTKNGMSSTWSKILSIRWEDTWRYPFALRPLSFMKNGDLLLLRSPAEFVVFNSKRHEFEQVKVDGLEASLDVFWVVRYVDTLLSPKS